MHDMVSIEIDCDRDRERLNGWGEFKKDLDFVGFLALIGIERFEFNDGIGRNGIGLHSLIILKDYASVAKTLETHRHENGLVKLELDVKNCIR